MRSQLWPLLLLGGVVSALAATMSTVKDSQHPENAIPANGFLPTPRVSDMCLEDRPLPRVALLATGMDPTSAAECFPVHLLNDANGEEGEAAKETGSDLERHYEILRHELAGTWIPCSTVNSLLEVSDSVRLEGIGKVDVLELVIDAPDKSNDRLALLKRAMGVEREKVRKEAKPTADQHIELLQLVETRIYCCGLAIATREGKEKERTFGVSVLGGFSLMIWVESDGAKGVEVGSVSLIRDAAGERDILSIGSFEATGAWASFKRQLGGIEDRRD